MQITNISDAKASLSQLIKTVQATHKPIIIGKAGNPVAILSAFIKDDAPRELTGHWKGKVNFSKDFNKTEDDLVDLFYSSSIFPE